ncbi:MAG: hypothetical protein J0M02_10685 [Planctomycetes bacterium]|nr:hypothetical protein [Planctomycetota bacterium]
MKAALLVLLAAGLAGGEVFADGTTAVFLGDSITHDGRWVRYVADYYATRFPERQVVLIDAGVSGDTAGGAMRRLDADVLVWKPDVVVAMLGMNDCGRDAYKSGVAADAALLAVRERHIATYGERMSALAVRIRQAGSRLILVAPSPYDDGATGAQAKLPGANAALGRCAAQLPRIAADAGAEVVDLHSPMTELGASRRAADPAFTLIGPDRVHPGSPGHLVMAWLFLTAQRAPSLVSRIHIDAARGVAEAEGAAVSGLVAAPEGISFTAQAAALPFPIAADARPALAWAPIEADLDRETLLVSGLAAGRWRLEIDGVAIATCTAAELAAGIDTARLDTPQRRQAAEVQRLNEQRRQIEQRLRAIAMVEWRILGPADGDIADPSVAMRAVERRLAEEKNAFLRRMLEEYRASRPQRDALRVQVVAMADDVRKAARPHTVRYRLVPQR